MRFTLVDMEEVGKADFLYLKFLQKMKSLLQPTNTFMDCRAKVKRLEQYSAQKVPAASIAQLLTTIYH